MLGQLLVILSDYAIKYDLIKHLVGLCDAVRSFDDGVFEGDGFSQNVSDLN